jgi:hypothetical protein
MIEGREVNKLFRAAARMSAPNLVIPSEREGSA